MKYMNHNSYCFSLLLFECYGEHRDLHVLTHSFPTRRSSDLLLQQQLVQDELVARLRVRAFGLGQGLDRQQHVGEGLRADLEARTRSEEHKSELQSLMRISYAVFC